MVVAPFAQDISREEADSLMKAMKVSKTNSDRMDILFKLSQFHMFKPGENAADLDSAKDYLEKATVLNTKIKSADADGFLLLLRSFLTREKAQMKEARTIADSALAVLKKGENKYYLGKAYRALSDYYDYNKPNEVNEKIRLVELACQAFQESGNIESHASALTFLADLYQLNNERPKALEKLDTVLLLYKSINYERLQNVYILYSNIYNRDGYYKQSLHYGLLALKNATVLGDTTMTLCQINNHVGLTLFQLKEMDKAIIYFLEAIRIARKYNDNSTVQLLMMNAVDTYIGAKRYDEALDFIKSIPEKFLEPRDVRGHFLTPFAYLAVYNKLKRFDKAQVYAVRIVQLMKMHKASPRLLTNLYTALITFFIDSGNYNSAGSYMPRLDSATRVLGDDIVRERINYSLRFRLDTALGHYKSAVANLLAFQKLNDSIFNKNSNKQITELEIQYESEKQKSEISILNQKNQLQKSNIDRQKLIKNFTLGGIALLVIILGLLYRQYLHKQKSSKVITQKNEQLENLVTEKDWLVKEIHHRVKNNFHTVASLLEIQSSYLKNKAALSAVKESQHRIYSMSIIHQKLYQSENLSTIHMPEYIYELVEYLRESYGIRDSIGFSLNIEKIELNHASAITLGLILNEAITNSIKYAFGGTDDKKITISLSHISEEHILLNIADNGRGLPVDFNSKIGASMGMELLQGLTDDLGGSFSIKTNNGTSIRVIFSYKHIVASQGIKV